MFLLRYSKVTPALDEWCVLFQGAGFFPLQSDTGTSAEVER